MNSGLEVPVSSGFSGPGSATSPAGAVAVWAVSGEITSSETSGFRSTSALASINDLNFSSSSPIVRQNKLDRSYLESLFSGLSNACGEGQEPTQVEQLGSFPSKY
jgi:hypothetical protein